MTNPDALSIPEEILLNDTGSGPTAYEILRRSNLIPQNQQVLSLGYLDELRGYMQIIHAEFGILYDAVNDPTFSMDIEYKIDSTGQLVIKQARPWIGFLEGGSAATEEEFERLKIKVWPNPASDQVNLSFYSLTPAALDISVMDVLGRKLKQVDIGTIPVGFHQTGIPVAGLPAGNYLVQLRLVYYDRVFLTVKQVVVR